MNRMDRIFKENKANGRGSLVLYFPIGDPILGDDVAWAGKYFENGCDVLEIGLPYEDPVLDGPTVAASMARALEVVDLEEVFHRIKKIREAYPDNILQIMTYYGNIEKYGIDTFAGKMLECGVDGVLAPNIPAEVMPQLDKALEKYEMYNIRFAPYTMTEEALADLKNNGKGYIFQQAVNGATGAQKEIDPAVKDKILFLKEEGIKTPVFAGFGVSGADHIRQHIERGADGCIVGSATISHIQAGDGEAYIKSLSDAL